MKITNNFNLPDPIVRALSHDDYTKGESNRSVTQLIDAPRIRILKKEHEQEITSDASELLWMALGKAVHRMFEDHGVGKWNPEERLFAEVSGWTISGQIDIQFHDGDPSISGANRVSLYDYKVTGVYSYTHWKESYDQQQNFYAWLARQNGLIVDGLFIVFIFRDWKNSDLRRNPKGYPPSPIMVVPANMWTPEAQDAYVKERVAIHQDAEFSRLTGDEPPFCSDEERWKSPSKFAVKKPANKTAKRVLDSKEEAEQYIIHHDLTGKGFEIEARPARPIRCADGWCPVAQWCSQWQAELAAGVVPEGELADE